MPSRAADEGWIPVIYNHSRHRGIIDSNKPLITLFVDNLPEDTSQPWLKMMFNKFGVVKDVFIPEKRSKATGNKFGFIRYDCPVSVDLAILWTNGIWLDNKKLFVKLASFEAKRNRPISSNSNREEVNLKAGMGHKIEQGSKAYVPGQNLDYSQQGLIKDRKTYAQVTKGVEHLGEQNTRKSIQCLSIGNGWLYRSAVAKIRKLLTKDLESVFNFQKVHDVQIKAIGGRYVVITFANEDIRDKIIKEKWVMNWFKDIKSWNGEHASEERFVWISCFGMPFSAWSSQTFKEIGNIWGDFLKVDENTLRGGSYEKGRLLIATDHTQRIQGVVELAVDGIRYLVRIEEEAAPSNDPAKHQDRQSFTYFTTQTSRLEDQYPKSFCIRCLMPALKMALRSSHILIFLFVFHAT
ncbi:hypothetical protein Vadar_020924 [Vaccinium darrowii]|uniref:Uncharacterized protein n=1 Tax=Vaccinium darrowii TaxID=229202 RepID=A0ACB7ZK90_9ERIC|nr:hypothetical protein Vadar_020924 [Vaccinium darrowii]